MQVVIGTLELLARQPGGGGAAPIRGGGPADLSGPDAGRLAALETQVQALTAQLEQMSDQLRNARAGGGALPPPPHARRRPAPTARRDPPEALGRRPSRPGAGPIRSSRFSPRPIRANRTRGPAPIKGDRRPVPARQAPSTSPGSRQMYEAAYGQLLQQNYPAAEAGFVDFLRQHPNDEMSANAQFWLGETHFVRGNGMRRPPRS